jgi:putative transposase
MPWQECNLMDERLKFIAGLLDGEKMAVLCRRFGVSRKTGYKILDRYNSCGLEGLTDRSRRPYRHANQLPVQIETLIVRSKQERPHWGAPKIRERLARLYPDIRAPAISTVHAVLDRHGLVKRRGRRRHKATGTPLSTSDQPNDLWCADYKGEFMLADRRYCCPLIITDFASRYLIACEASQSTREAYAFTVFENVFKEFGLPNAIRTDNGVPFASPNALFNLSKLSVWWLRPGISLFPCSGEMAAWAYEVQHRYRETLLGQTPFDELQFNVGQLGFKKVLIAINIPQMGMQSGNSFVHNHPLAKCIIYLIFKLGSLNTNYSLNSSALQMAVSREQMEEKIKRFANPFSCESTIEAQWFPYDWQTPRSLTRMYWRANLVRGKT